MATLIKQRSHVENALRFLNTYGLASVTDERLYLATGLPAGWGDPENPDVLTDSIDEGSDFWSTVIGMKLIQSTDVIPVVPRIDWTNGDTYVVIDTSSNISYTSSFYVMNNEYRVYHCIVAGGGASTQEPLLAAEDVNGLITAGDGYSWQYLYELSQVIIDDILNDTWLPINYSDFIDGGDTKRDDLAIYKLWCKYILILVKLEDTETDLGVDGTSYSQTAIISNPLDSGGSVKLAATTAPAGGVTANTGHILHLENKYAVTRALNQTEIVQTVLQF